MVCGCTLNESFAYCKFTGNNKDLLNDVISARDTGGGLGVYKTPKLLDFRSHTFNIDWLHCEQGVCK